MQSASELAAALCGARTAFIRGAGTRPWGRPVEAEVALDTTGLDRIVEHNVGDLTAIVQAGVTRKQLNKALRRTGLTFTVDPGADASIGGMAATRASGTTAVRYGTMRENVLGLTVVLPDGRVIKTGTRARKSAAGYDLTRLFVGSEGTLGVMTEVTVRLHPVPEAVSAAVCSFESMAGAVDTVIATVQLGVPVARMELMDETQMDAVNRYSKTSYAVAPTLFFEFHGSEAGVVEQSGAVKVIAGDFNAGEFRWSMLAEERNKLWQARHNAYYAALNLRPGAKGWPTDVCVPISRLADCIVETKQDIEEHNLLAPIVGHVGDGNFHTSIVLDPNNPADLRAAEEFNQRLVSRAQAMGGTCTG